MLTGGWFPDQVEQVGPNFRTLPALQRTQAHLHSILDRTDVPLGKIHYYLWERHRSVRQDLFVQGMQAGLSILPPTPL